MNLLKCQEPLKVSHLFADWNETMIWSYLDGCMGECYVDNIDHPQSAQIIVADFHFLAGQVHEEFVKNVKEEYAIIVPQNKEWGNMIEKVYGKKAVLRTRYATLKDENSFDIVTLQNNCKTLIEGYTMERIDEHLYDEIMSSSWKQGHDLCSQFQNAQDYQKHGLGFVVRYQGEIVAGASSYTYYRNGIEIEIDTRSDYRQKGLAKMCASQLILECLKRNLYPSWDAHHQISLSLAIKLGYHFDQEYTVYEIIKSSLQ